MEPSNANFEFPFPAASETPYTPTAQGDCTLEYTPYQSPASRAASAASSVTASPATSLAGGSSSPERYTPTKPGLRIRKRKPIPDRYNLKGTKYEGLDKYDERKDGKLIKSVAELLLMSPGKSILLKDRLARSKARRSVNFSDESGLPLVAIQEIPSVRNGQPASDDEARDAEQRRRKLMESDTPPLRLVKCHSPERKNCQSVSETAIIERQRIHDKGIMTGPIFGVVELEDDPELARQAAEALGRHVPPRIPLNHISTARGSLIRDLPLPGRKQVENTSALDISQEQMNAFPRYTPSPVEESMAVEQSSISESKIEIIQLSEPPVTEYYATTSFGTADKTNETASKSLSSLIGSLSSVAKSLLSSKAAAQKAYGDSVGQQIEEVTPSTSEMQATYYVGRVYADNNQQQNHNNSGPSNQQIINQYQNNHHPQQEYAYRGQFNSRNSPPPSYGASNTNQHGRQQNARSGMRKTRFSPPVNVNSNTNQHQNQQYAPSGPNQPILANPKNGDAGHTEYEQDGVKLRIRGNPYVQGGFGFEVPCTYFVYKADGCNRGDSCKYAHDVEQRNEMLRKKARQQARKMSPPLAHQMRSDAMGKRSPLERVGPKGERVSRFDPINRPPVRDRRYYDQRGDARRPNDRPNQNRRTRFEPAGSNSPPNIN